MPCKCIYWCNLRSIAPSLCTFLFLPRATMIPSTAHMSASINQWKPLPSMIKYIGEGRVSCRPFLKLVQPMDQLPSVLSACEIPFASPYHHIFTPIYPQCSHVQLRPGCLARGKHKGLPVPHGSHRSVSMPFSNNVLVPTLPILPPQIGVLRYLLSTTWGTFLTPCLHLQ